MELKIDLMTNEDLSEYVDFVNGIPQSLIYTSDVFRRFLKDYFHDEDFYFIARNNNEIVGILPVFLKKTKLGSVMNSLPFFGSNGGLLISNNDGEVGEALIDEYYKLAEKKGCISSTMITSPLLEYDEIYRKYEYDFTGSRIGLFTELNETNALLSSLESSVRWSIKKALKNDVVVKEDYSSDAWDFLYDEQYKSMLSMGALPKEKSFYRSVRDTMEEGKDYKLYIGNVNDEKASGLLVLMHNEVVEYYVPVTSQKYRSIQPLSLICFKAMEDAWESGYKLWNWGGTTESQTGVYAFKKRWSSIENNYYYYTRIHDNSIYKLTKDDVMKNFPNYYVIPFDKLIQETGKEL